MQLWLAVVIWDLLFVCFASLEAYSGADVRMI